MHRILRPLKYLILGYVLICLLMYTLQRHMIYIPTKGIEKPETYGLNEFTILRLKSNDGVNVKAWHREAKAGHPTIVFFHGNAGNLGDRADYFSLLARAGFGILAMDYRGYGASEGDPSEQGFYQDARAVMEYAENRLSLPSNQIIIYGESIGSGVAVQMASEYQSAALVLQSPFSSLEALAKNNYPWLPVRILLKDRFDSLSKMPKVHEPLLLLHGEKDTLVPMESGKMIFEAAIEPKKAVYFPFSGHNDMSFNLMAKELVIFCNEQRLIN